MIYKCHICVTKLLTAWVILKWKLLIRCWNLIYCQFLQNHSDVAAKISFDEIGNIIILLRRMFTIVLLTQRSRLSGPFRYLTRFHKVYRIFFRSIWKSFQMKTGSFVRIFQADFDLHFFKFSIFTLFLIYNLLGVLYGHDFFLLTWRYGLNRHSRYLGFVHEAHKNISGDIWKKFELNYEQE